MFSSLVAALESYFDTPFEALPQPLQNHIKTEFSPLYWDDLSLEQRRSLAAQWDRQNDPVLEEKREYWFNHFVEIHDIEREIEAWEAIPTPTALDFAEKKTQIAKLRHQRTALAQQMDCPLITGLPTGESESAKGPRRTAKRNQELQHDANTLAKRWKEEGRRNFSKREIAEALARSGKWKEMTAIRVERLIRVEWSLL